VAVLPTAAAVLLPAIYHTADYMCSRVSLSMRTNGYAYRELKCADTIGTVPVPWAVYFNAKILIYFSNKMYGSNFIKQHSETVVV